MLNGGELDGVNVSPKFITKDAEDRHQVGDGIAAEIADALAGGASLAYTAVSDPTEGTILTVAREAAEAADRNQKS